MGLIAENRMVQQAVTLYLKSAHKKSGKVIPCAEDLVSAYLELHGWKVPDELGATTPEGIRYWREWTRLCGRVVEAGNRVLEEEKKAEKEARSHGRR